MGSEVVKGLARCQVLDAREQFGCRPKVRLPDLRTYRVRPRLLGLSDGYDRVSPGISWPEQLRSLMIGVLCIRSQPIANEQVCDSLNTLPCLPQPSGDLGHAGGTVRRGIQHYPVRQRLIAQRCKLLADRRELRSEPRHLHDERGKCLAGRRPHRLQPAFDSMLSF
jgi:hypothetical protein